MFKIIAFFIIKLFSRLYLRVTILIYLENKYNYIMHIIAFSIIKLRARVSQSMS